MIIVAESSITGWHGSARVLYRRQRKSMEKWKIRPPLPQKPLNRSSPKFAWVITWGINHYPYAKFHHDTITPPSPPQICENANQVTRLVFLVLPSAKTPAPIFTINTSNDAVSRKNETFGGSENKILHFDPIPPKKRKCFANFWRDNFESKKP